VGNSFEKVSRRLWRIEAQQLSTLRFIHLSERFDATRSPDAVLNCVQEYLAHTPLIQSENQSGEWGKIHGKRGFSQGRTAERLPETEENGGNGIADTSSGSKLTGRMPLPFSFYLEYT